MDRYQATGKIDLDYLQGLSADAVPVLDTLPEPQRSCVLSSPQRTGWAAGWEAGTCPGPGPPTCWTAPR